MHLYHVSEELNIQRFDPRPAPSGSGLQGNFVWAVDEAHLPNYLLPRDCPRVCFARGAETSQRDIARFLEHAADSRVIAVEWNWLERIRAVTLHVYSFPCAPFECIDAGAGYYVSSQSVLPIECHTHSDILNELSKRNVELRIVKDLWPLHNDVANSSLEFSMIRMRNAPASIN